MKKDIQKRGSRPELPTPSGSRSDTPETDALERDGYHYAMHNMRAKLVPSEHARKLERERDELREWIMQAAPILLAAGCIVVDEAAERLDEIAGVCGVLEMCPVDFAAAEEKSRDGSAVGLLVG